MPTNPILDELGSLSPGAQQALMGAHNATTLAPPPVDPGLQAPSKIQKPAQIGAPPPAPAAQMTGPPPTLGAPPSPHVSLPVPGTEQGDTLERQRLLGTGSGIHQIQNPELRGLAGVGNALGHIVAPGLMRAIPGTEEHHNLLLGQTEKRLGTDIDFGNKQAEENLRGAQTGEANARTGLTTAQAAAVPEHEADTHALVQPTIEHLGAETHALQDPHAKTAFEAWQKENPNGKISDWLELQAENKPDQKQNDFEQFYKDYLADNKLPDSAHNRLQARSKFAAAGQMPQRAPITNLIFPGQNGGPSTLQSVRSGQAIPEGAQTVAGMNAVNTPTTQQRTAAGRAATVVAMAPEVLSEIDRLGPKLGPVAGRWNDFMQGKVGMDDPEFAGLRTDLVMLSSAVALAHAVGRLPENLRLEFDHMINAPQQTPENIKATINHVLPWLQKMQEQGGGRQGAAGGGDIVYDDKGVGHRYNGTGNRNDPKNYTAVQ